ncbi:hypothetical protein BPAE_0126g00250 [Botrytis paeoniae]|uniref:Uncharacterized protein n=1 Tax=Botrytis paeoniae TaxID=278948 RepID=A0A4Z1FPW4_9HELO|nr:hypothetical protein BPAE_0126g00250 [Botrytis paeoniae]
MSDALLMQFFYLEGAETDLKALSHYSAVLKLMTWGLLGISRDQSGIVAGRLMIWVGDWKWCVRKKGISGEGEWMMDGVQFGSVAV